MPSEDQLIARIGRSVLGGRRRGGRRPGRGGLRLGIGDDAAIIGVRSGGGAGGGRRAGGGAANGRGIEWVLSCDAFVEGVHFLAKLHPADSVGYKALARATSDLAAMGAKPRFFLLTLALPHERAGKWLDGFLRGLRRAAHDFGMTLIGGDTTRSKAIFASVTVIGEVAAGGAVKRSGARVGDRIYVSGRLGAAQLGLMLLRAGAKPAGDRAQRLKAHLYPRIRVELGEFLARERIASAMIDISDGLSTDLSRLCAASHVGVRIWAERIPCVKIPVGPSGKPGAALARQRLDSLKLALDGGEDYELLFTVAPKDEKRLRQAPGFGELQQIGEIVRGGKVTLIQKNGSEKRLAPGGWDPFRTR